MKEYTTMAFLSVCCTIILDRVLGTRVLGRKAFWVFVMVMMFFMIIANGYLTWRPIVIYNPAHILNIRLWTIPVEDFLYGFSLMASSVILWEFFRRKGSE